MKNYQSIQSKKIAIMLIGLIGFTQSSADLTIKKYTIVQGGGSSQSQNHDLNGSIGQKVIGQSNSANGYQLAAGFWVERDGDLIFRNGFE